MDHILDTPIYWIFITLGTYFLAHKIHDKLKFALTAPILLTVVALIILLSVLEIEFDTYEQETSMIRFFLGPSVVALGALLHEKYEEVKNSLKPFLISVVLGGATSILMVVWSLDFIGVSDSLIRSMAPKSVTTPIALEISKSVSGIPPITAGVVIAVGIFGNAFGPYILKTFGVTDKNAQGTALGTASHGIGTARAIEINSTAAAYGGAAICVNGVITAILTPIILNWFLIQ